MTVRLRSLSCCLCHATYGRISCLQCKECTQDYAIPSVHARHPAEKATILVHTQFCFDVTISANTACFQRAASYTTIYSALRHSYHITLHYTTLYYTIKIVYRTMPYYAILYHVILYYTYPQSTQHVFFCWLHE